MKDLIVAGIVLYNPDIPRLTENINAIIDQVDYVILADNGSSNKDLFPQAFPVSDKIVTIYSPENRGIAWALNRIFEKAVNLDAAWVLTLDQDSVCPPDIVRDYRTYLASQGSRSEDISDPAEHIGILCPTIVDKNAGIIEGGHPDPRPTKRCITSGALTSCRGWIAIHGFDEKMFIDGVDFDYCDRLWHAGYQVIRIGSIHLTHELGHMTTHRFLFSTVKVQNHSALRKYYIVRNRFYLSRKQGKPLAVLGSFCFVIKFSATILLYEQDKKAKMHAVFRGVRDGLRM